MKKLALLGSTGSIGTQTLDIVRQYPDRFQVTAMSAGKNVALLSQQVEEFRPELVAIADQEEYHNLKQALSHLDPQPQILAGTEGICAVASHAPSQVVVTGIVGCAGLLPTIAAIKAGKNIALANKETLIAGGAVIQPLLQEYGVKLFPADSEHSAIFQCLQGVPEGGLARIILTASGGAFRDLPADRLADVTITDALKHPNWTMGKKITIDSATLMNKGLEVIEAHYLFGLDYDAIEIVIHSQSIIHSLIELKDTSVLAQLGLPDMRLPLLYALSYPDRLVTNWERLDLVKCASLTFRSPDHQKYPCMELAYSAGRKGGTMPAVLNAANEEAVALFLAEKIRFTQIAELIAQVCSQHHTISSPSLSDILESDRWARETALSCSGLG